jgi:lipoprotein-releasing system permease protein
LFTFDDKQEVTYLKGIDANFSKVNDITKNTLYGQWVEPDTYQVVVGYGSKFRWDYLISTIN